MSGSIPSIMEFTTDLSTQEQPEALPGGEYPAEVSLANFKVSGTSGNTYLHLEFRISADAYPADFTDGDPDGVVLHYNRLVVKPETPMVKWRLKKGLEAMGAKVGRTLDPNDLIGLSATVLVEVGEYEGEPRAEIRKIIGT